MGPLLCQNEHLLPRSHNGPRPPRPQKKILQRLLPLAPARLDQTRRLPPARHHALHLPRRPFRHRIRTNRPHHPHARGRPRRPFRQRRHALTALFAGAGAHFRGLRRTAEHVSRLPGGRCRLARPLRHLPKGSAPALGPRPPGPRGLASLQSLCSARNDRRALFRKGALRNGRPRPVPGIRPRPRRPRRNTDSGGTGGEAAAVRPAPALGRGQLLLPRIRSGGDGGAPSPPLLSRTGRVRGGQSKGGTHPRGTVLAAGEF
mmetsp:Transcript_4813/g.9517  ORF Transcript_4813/g.9517 Transcript_4813/m.9517 type:complete len:260 (-) Transcript_4813:434-1213(-)